MSTPPTPPATVIRVHVDRLDFGTQPAACLEVPKDDELARPHHLAGQLGHQHDAAISRAVGQRGTIRIEIVGILPAEWPP
jgi:hypothetical protein